MYKQHLSIVSRQGKQLNDKFKNVADVLHSNQIRVDTGQMEQTTYWTWKHVVCIASCLFSFELVTTTTRFPSVKNFHHVVDWLGLDDDRTWTVVLPQQILSRLHKVYKRPDMTGTVGYSDAKFLSGVSKRGNWTHILFTSGNTFCVWRITHSIQMSLAILWIPSPFYWLSLRTNPVPFNWKFPPRFCQMCEGELLVFWFCYFHPGLSNK